MKLVRWFLGNAVDRAFKMGFIQFLDFASGLPTVDHIHTRIPENVKNKVKIMYSDIDPLTVKIGSKEIIGENPLVKFEKCDCRKPGTLLESEMLKDFFDINLKFTIGLNGIFYFLTDEQLEHTLKILYDWAPTGSIIYFCDYDSENIKDEVQAVFEYYKNIKQPLFFRSQKKIKEIIQPWRIKEPGLQILEKWTEVTLDISEQQQTMYGGSMYGGFLKK